MLITIAEQQKVPAELVHQATEYANLTAGWAFLTMLEWGFTPEQMSCRPAALILELGALRHIAWLNQCANEAGLYLSDLPNHKDEEEGLFDRIENDPESFSSINGARLTRRMFEFQMKNFAWDLPTNSPAVLAQLYLIRDNAPDELDSLLDALAEAICSWQ